MSEVSPAMESSPVRTLWFSTDDFPLAKRLEACRDIYGRTIIKHDIEPIDDRPFRFAGDFYAAPNLGLASYSMTACRAPRRPQHIDGDDLVLSIMLSGSRIVQQRGREAEMHAGEAALTTSSDTGVVTLTSDCRLVSLRFSQAALRPRLASFDDALVRTLPRQTPGLNLLSGYIDTVIGTGALTEPRLYGIVVEHLYDLASLALGAISDHRYAELDGGPRAARRLAILREIDRRSGDPGLSSAAIAAGLGITPRYVHLLLEETGKSFTHHVLERRLQKAAALLRDPRQHASRIADIAAEAGFTDLSYFNRSFRRHFDMTPSDLRRSEGRIEDDE